MGTEPGLVNNMAILGSKRERGIIAEWNVTPMYPYRWRRQ